MKRKSILLVLVILSVRVTLGTSYSGPVKHTVYSSNGKFFALIDPQKAVQNIYRSEKPGKVCWSFRFSPENDAWFIPDNGECAVCIRWRFVRSEDLDNPAVIIFRKDGSRKEHSYNSLVKARKTGLFETAPKGSSWRVWYESLSTKNNRVEINTYNETRIVISGDYGRLDTYRD